MLSLFGNVYALSLKEGKTSRKEEEADNAVEEENGRVVRSGITFEGAKSLGEQRS